MALINPDPGTLDWYLKRQVYNILNRNRRYDRNERYVVGNHPFPMGDKRYVKALYDFQKMARTNYFGLVTQSPVERMRVLGLKFGQANEADTEASDMMLANDWDYQEAMIHLYAATFGDAYVLVSPPDEWSNGQPIFTMEDPRMCGVEYDTTRPTMVNSGVRMWEDELSSQVLAMVMLKADSPSGRARVGYYIGPKAEALEDCDLPTLTRRLTTFGHEESFNLVDVQELPIPTVPLVRYAWNPSLNDVSLSEGEVFNLFDIQDRINQQVLDKLVISRAQAYKQRYASGIKIPEGPGGRKKPPFDPGSDILWATEAENVKFGEFSEADIRQVLESITQDVGDMAAISKTPPHYLLGKIVNASGDALKASEAGLVSKTRLRMRAMGFGHERVLRTGFLYLKNPKATDSGQVMWGDPEEQQTSALADAGLKYTQMGIPLALAMEKMQFNPEEIAFAVAEKKKEDARQAALAAVVGAGAGKPVGSSSGNTNAQATGRQGGQAPAGNGTKANQPNKTNR
jgi:hypothetical protein